MRLLAVALLLLSLAATSGPSSAAPPVENRVAQAAGVQPLGTILRAIGQSYPGRALDAELLERAEPPVYRIKWLGEDGKVRELRVDARTGRILEVR